MSYHIVEEWVFHGTYNEVVFKIIEQGFKIGGKDDGVNIRHGTALGHGIYTAEGPTAPMNLLLHTSNKYVMLLLSYACYINISYFMLMSFNHIPRVIFVVLFIFYIIMLYYHVVYYNILLLLVNC